MTGDVRKREIPCTRDAGPIRRARIIAARAYAPRSIPRTAILLGHWDGGDVVGRASLKEKEHA
ncbi:MAG: hypothetical protein ACM3ZV_07570 [Bacillota bacterium]